MALYGVALLPLWTNEIYDDLWWARMSKNHFLLQCWEFSRQDLQVIHFDDDADGIEDDVDDIEDDADGIEDDVDDEHEDDSQGLEIENLAAK